MEFPDTQVTLMCGDSFMVDDTKPLSDAVKWYDEFNQMKVQKVVFEADK
jgi:uncharacterized protein YlzI (FlbEa/FlbD family)